MSDWSEFFVGSSAVATADEPEREASGGSWMRRLRQNLTASRRAMAQQIASVAFDPADDQAWERIEEGLIAADVGVTSTVAIVERLEAEAAAGRLATGHQLAAALRSITAEMMTVPGYDRLDVSAQPTVVLMVGINGTGKTTTIGKLAYRLSQVGKRCVVAAGDTFRAAAGEQLEVWADRAGAKLVRHDHGGDPAAVAFEAIERAQAGEGDVVLIDTAGRLHTQVNLMQELAKVRRVVERKLEGAPHETLLTVDATTGQNGMRQAQEFKAAVDITGVALTKLDGSAKGGIAVAIANELALPIKLVGIGESLDDLRPFDVQQFAQALFPDDLLGA